MFSALLIIGLGIGSMVVGIQARSSEEFEKTVTMVDTSTNGDLDIDKVTLAVIILGFFCILGALGGCYGAFTEHRGAVCGFSIFLLVFGGVVGGMALATAAYVKAAQPFVYKEVNRLCRDPALTRQMLNCAAEAQTVYNAPGTNGQPTIPPTNQESTGARRLQDTTRHHTTGGRLAALGVPIMTSMQALGESNHLHLLADGFKSYMEPFGRPLRPEVAFSNHTGFLVDEKTRITTTAFLHHKHGGVSGMMSILYREALEVQGAKGRQLAAGTTEKNFISSSCDKMKADGYDCQSNCQLLDELCVQPDGFNALEACVCDPKGPQKLSAADMETIEQSQCPTEMEENGVCQGSFCSIPNYRREQGNTAEGCWVYPTSMCHGDLGTPIPGNCDTNNGNGLCVGQPYYAEGPCVDPDSRSKMVLEGFEACKMVIGFIFFLGCLLLLTSMCSCCLFCELHTGKSADSHARSIMYGDTDSEEDGSYDEPGYGQPGGYGGGYPQQYY